MGTTARADRAVPEHRKERHLGIQEAQHSGGRLSARDCVGQRDVSLRESEAMTVPSVSGSRLLGKICVITGTGGSIGRAAALAFAREGASVVGCDLNVDASEATVQMVR